MFSMIMTLLAFGIYVEVMMLFFHFFLIPMHKIFIPHPSLNGGKK